MVQQTWHAVQAATCVGAHQAAAEVLRELARFEEGTPLVSGPPDFLGGRCGVAQCNDCGCERPTLLSDDCRVHDVLQSELRAAMGDPIKALQSRLFDECRRSVVWTIAVVAVALGGRRVGT